MISSSNHYVKVQVRVPNNIRFDCKNEDYPIFSVEANSKVSIEHAKNEITMFLTSLLKDLESEN